MTTPTLEAVSEERLREIIDGFTGLEVCADSDLLDHTETLALATELLALRANGVKVKALEWELYGSKFRARSSCGLYIVSEKSPGRWWYSRDNQPFAQPFATAAEAKAAAQTDYERRIISALTPVPESPSPASGQEPVGFISPETLQKLLKGKAANHADISAARGNIFTTPLYAHPPASKPAQGEGVADKLAQTQAALVAWVNVAEMLAGEPGMDAHFHDVADATLDIVTEARAALTSQEQS
jgi:hypothetical protein